jgi:hypothetical protein
MRGVRGSYGRFRERRKGKLQGACLYSAAGRAARHGERWTRGRHGFIAEVPVSGARVKIGRDGRMRL